MLLLLISFTEDWAGLGLALLSHDVGLGLALEFCELLLLIQHLLICAHLVIHSVVLGRLEGLISHLGFEVRGSSVVIL